MTEYLNKETLQEKLNRKKAGPATKRYTEGWNDAILMVKSMIHSEKAADVAQIRHGRWVKQDDYSCCSGCGQSIADECVPWFKFCPNCGAIMDLEEEQHELRRDL